MWDIYDRMTASSAVKIDLEAIPVIRSYHALLGAIRHSTTKPGQRIEILHAQFGSLVGFLGAIKPAKCRIVSLRGSDIYWRFGSPRNRLANRLRTMLSWIACFRAHAIVVMSRAMARKVQSWPFLHKRRIHVLVDPAGDIFWQEACLHIGEAVRKQSFNVMIASLVDSNPVKRLSLIAEAVDLCCRAGMTVQLTALSGMSREAVRDAIRQSDCVAIASTHEGWPNIIKEALLMGRPFVATDVSDLADFAGQDSESRIVAATPLDFAMAWADQIAAKLLKPHGVAPALASFHPDICALKHELLYLAYSTDLP